MNGNGDFDIHGWPTRKIAKIKVAVGKKTGDLAKFSFKMSFKFNPLSN